MFKENETMPSEIVQDACSVPEMPDVDPTIATLLDELVGKVVNNSVRDALTFERPRAKTHRVFYDVLRVAFPHLPNEISDAFVGAVGKKQVDPPAKGQKDNNYQIGIHFVENEKKKVARFSSMSQQVARIWRAALYCAIETKPERTREECVEIFGGGSENERTSLIDWKKGVEEEANKDGNVLFGAKGIVAADARLSDNGIILPENENSVFPEQRKVSEGKGGMLGFNQLLEKDGSVKYDAIRGVFVDLRDGRTFVVNNLAHVKKKQIFFDGHTASPDELKEKYGIDAVYESDLLATVAYVKEIRDGLHDEKAITLPEFNWAIPGANNVKEALGVHNFSEKFWTVVEPDGQNTKVDSHILEEELPLSLFSIINSSRGSEDPTSVQHKSCNLQCNAYQCNLSSHDILYSILDFRSGVFTHVIIRADVVDDIFRGYLATTIQWLITVSEFFDKDCNVFGKTRGERGCGNVTLHRFDKPITRPPTNPKYKDWRWTRYKMLCRLFCLACNISFPTRVDLCNRDEKGDICEFCEACGGKMDVQFEVPIEASDDLPNYLLQRLLVQIIKFDVEKGRAAGIALAAANPFFYADNEIVVPSSASAPSSSSAPLSSSASSSSAPSSKALGKRPKKN